MTCSRPVVLPFLLTGVAQLACSGTETGNPPRATASFSLVSSDAQHFAVGAGGVGVEISQAHIGVQQLTFVRCADQALTQVAEAVSVDLLGGDSTFEVPEQALCAVELSFEPRDIGWAAVRPGSAPDLSFGLAGLTTLGVPLFIEDEATPRVVFRPTAFEVTPGTGLVLSLDVASALSFDDIEQLPPDNDAEVVISNQSNDPVLLDIRQRFAPSWSLWALSGSGSPELVASGAPP
jgi:hypothetical protein